MNRPSCLLPFALLPLALLLVVCPLSDLHADVEQWGMVELTFESTQFYDHPIYDVRLDVIFRSPDGTERLAGAFWDGGSTWRARFAPDVVGTWSWRTVSSDEENEGFVDRDGTFEVTDYRGDDPYRSRGWLKVSPNGRYLTYGDGTPFYYLGCTAWEMAWRSYPDEVDHYLEDRKAKGFNAVQTVVFSHRQFQEFGVINRSGHAALLRDENLGRLNPAYFRHLDTIVMRANASGIMVTLVPLWAAMAWLYYPGGHRFPFERKEALSLARYVASRYGGFNVLWIVGGDDKYDTDDRRIFWSEFARQLDTAGGGLHLLTTHTSGWDASWKYYDNTTDWLDFHTYHSSHYIGNDFQWDAAEKGYALEPPIPVVNGEPAYEDIYHNFSPDSVRIGPEWVRQAQYESLLSGGLVGTVYGANSIWQWHNGDYAVESHHPRVDVLEALDFPGGLHVAIMKQLMEHYEWYRFEPRSDLVRWKPYPSHVPCALQDSMAMLYFAVDVHEAVVDFSDLGDSIDLLWIEPTTGESIPEYAQRLAATDSVPIGTPDTTDWILVVETVDLGELPEIPDDPEYGLALTVDRLAGVITIVGDLVESGRLEIRLFDLGGRLLHEDREVVTSTRIDRRLPIIGSGTLLVQVDLVVDRRTARYLSEKIFLP